MSMLAGSLRIVLTALLGGWLILTGATAAGTELDHLLFQTVRRGDNSMLRGLLRPGTPVDVRAADGTTPLMYAALRGNVESVKLLLVHGANPDAANDDGATALLWGAGSDVSVALLDPAGLTSVKHRLERRCQAR